MDRYLTARKPASSRPYPIRTKLDPLAPDGEKPSSSAITRHLLGSLSDKSNPITHSDIYERSDTVVAAASGHQRGEGRTPHGVSAKAYFEDRSRKLSRQREYETPKGVLSDVRVYIDGYLAGTTDTEVRRMVARAGGTTLLVPSGATHIVTSRQLSGSKTHRILTTKSTSPVHVVKPEWVTDSITAGRRLKESRYAVIKPLGTRSIVDMLTHGGPTGL